MLPCSDDLSVDCLVDGVECPHEWNEEQSCTESEGDCVIVSISSATQLMSTAVVAPLLACAVAAVCVLL